MKKRFALLAFGLLIFSCSPKVAQPVASTTPTPAPTGMPENASPATAMLAGPASSEDIALGKELYQNNCANCHKLFAPEDFTQEQWKPILVRMQHKARMDDIEMSSINNYINSIAAN